MRVGSFFSYHQLNKTGILYRTYNKSDVIIIQDKIKKIESNNNENLKEKKEKMLFQQRKNLNFVIQMINQEILEKAC